MVEGQASGVKSGWASGSWSIAQCKFQREFFMSQPTSLGVVAQLAEHLLCKQGVAGSNPAGSTMS
jgi:hypothetical protein